MLSPKNFKLAKHFGRSFSMLSNEISPGLNTHVLGNNLLNIRKKTSKNTEEKEKKKKNKTSVAT